VRAEELFDLTDVAAVISDRRPKSETPSVGGRRPPLQFSN